MEFGGVGSDSERRKKRYHRHTAHQIQRLEAAFRECPHPDEKQRLQLSRELGLAPRQIKFWFQNRRTQMKAQHERADNCALRAENDKIRCENIAIREALKNVICTSCGGPPVTEDPCFEEQRLRMENAQLREELERVSSIAAKYIGRPLTQLPPLHVSSSSLDLSVAGFGPHGGIPGPTLDFDLLPGASSSASVPAAVPNFTISDVDKSLMSGAAVSAMEELLRVLRTNEPLWSRGGDGRDILDPRSYKSVFLKNPNARIEASRCSGAVFMNASALVDMFMDCNKWMELFPCIVSASKTLSVVASEGLGAHGGSLILMYEEVQVLSPLAATREFCMLRCCQQLEQGIWAIVNVSYDIPQLVPRCRSSRLPSGCLIEDMPDGYCKVTWAESIEVDEKEPVNRLFSDLIHSRLAFGAERWLANLQRMCERLACLVSGTSSHELGGFPSQDGKRSMMKLAQRMVNNFCANVGTSSNHQSTNISGVNEAGVRVTARRSNDAGQPNGMILSAATTFWLPVSPQNIFNFLKDERNRPQWDVLSNGNAVQEVAHIANWSHCGNCISILRGLNSAQNNMLILQESCVDSSGSFVVYSPIDLPAINIAMSGQEPSCIPLLPSGFAIMPDGRNNHGDGASTSSDTHAGVTGSLVTVAFQILVSSLPTAKLNMESVATVNNLIGTTVHQIKTGLNCHSS